jgi:hypothetical protein
MARRSGSAILPLHGGRVPPWLATRMSALGAIITQAIVHHYGRDEFLQRLSHPFWFQSFGAVMGMDWHSSGITTSVIGALKRGLGPLSAELGIHVCGGFCRDLAGCKRAPLLVCVGEVALSQRPRRGCSGEGKARHGDLCLQRRRLFSPSQCRAVCTQSWRHARARALSRRRANGAVAFRRRCRADVGYADADNAFLCRRRQAARLR